MFNPVRHKVKDLVELVQDDDRLKQERKRSKKNRDKYKGVSSEDFSRSYSMIFFLSLIGLFHNGSIYYYYQNPLTVCCFLLQIRDIVI